MEKLELIKGMYHAVGTGDFPGFLNAMAADLEWNEAENFPYADNNPYIGPEAIATGIFGRIAVDWDDFILSDLEFHDTTGESVIVTGRYNGKHKITAKTMRAQFAHVWRVKNGKAVSFQQYADTKQVTEVMK